MQKIIIDTNVIVSSLIQRSYPYRIIYHHFIEDKFILCVSDDLISEYHEVLKRPKFAGFPDFVGKARSLLADIESKALKFSPTLKIEIISDKTDNMILELADECDADYIITGNTNDFIIANYKRTKIISPREYWESFKSEL
jgi:putative PIN family toxin of toxin-antitoxin system